MRIFAFLLSFLFFISLHSQNIEDAYRDMSESPVLFPDHFIEYDGEYQIFLDKLYWSYSENDFHPFYYILGDAATSFSIEVVSFPFLPADGLADANKSSDRILNTWIVDGDYTYGKDLFRG